MRFSAYHWKVNGIIMNKTRSIIHIPLAPWHLGIIGSTLASFQSSKMVAHPKKRPGNEVTRVSSAHKILCINWTRSKADHEDQN